jgi:hypothetical protein
MTLLSWIFANRWLWKRASVPHARPAQKRGPRRVTALHGWSAPLAVLASLTALSRSAGAEPVHKRVDGVYGRFDGDLDLSLAAGAALGPVGPHLATIGRLLFLQTAGIYVAYTDALGSAEDMRRSAALGIAVRPLFIPRWGLDLEHGPALLDLTLDAITFDIGVLWPSNSVGRFDDSPGMEMALGTEVPLFGSATGLFLGARGALRWRGSELATGATQVAALAPALLLTLSWHHIIDANIVDAGDRNFR